MLPPARTPSPSPETASAWVRQRRLGRSALVGGFALGLGLALASAQACILPFECIYIYNKGHQACGTLEPVVSSNGTGPVEIIDNNGSPPQGCTCLPPELEVVLFEDPASPELDELYAEIETKARQRCIELANQIDADITPCLDALFDELSVTQSEQTYDACKYLIGKIDEDKDGYCPDPDAGEDEAGDTDTGDPSTDTGDTGVLFPDLPKEPP